MPAGHWSGAHAVGWDRNAPHFGDREVGDGFQKHSYIFSIMVNANGERFVDEGADFRNFTYAKYGRVVQQQPGMFAWQVFDQKVEYLLRDEYRIKQVTKVIANTLEELAGKLDGVDPKAFSQPSRNTTRRCSRTCRSHRCKDGRGTAGLGSRRRTGRTRSTSRRSRLMRSRAVSRSRSAASRLRPTPTCRNVGGRNIPGLYAAGEMVGGLFYFNYPSGSGLVSGAVFGRRAGTSAARYARGAS